MSKGEGQERGRKGEWEGEMEGGGGESQAGSMLSTEPHART